MFFQWHMSRSKLTSCYIDSIVPTPEDGLVANKTYTSSGSLNEIQIWNITTRPAKPWHEEHELELAPRAKFELR